MGDAEKLAEQKGLPASNWKLAHTLGILGSTTALVSCVFLVQRTGLRGAWVVLAAGLLALAAVSGHGIRGVWRGMFIDERNMISLSRLQMLIWTVVVLSAYGALALARVRESPLEALDVAVPEELWYLMGISTTSLLGSPLIKNTKRSPNAAPQNVDRILDDQRAGLSEQVRREGRIVSKKNVGDASWSDLFTGEEVTNVTYLDLAKIQMFFFTIVLVLSYGAAVWSLLSAECAASASQGLSECRIPTGLPQLSDGAIALLAISHGGYLANKAVPASSES